MARIIIAVDASERSEDAVAFVRVLAEAGGSAVTLANAYPWAHVGRLGGQEYDEVLREASEKTLARLSDPLHDFSGLETRALPDPSPSRALQALAEELEAGLIVVGSSHTGHLGRVLPGSTAERLLHGSPCPVAVVPHGYRSASKGEPRVIACAWDGGPESEAALLAAEALAKELSASLRVISVFEVPCYVETSGMGMGYAQVMSDFGESARRALRQRVAHVADDVRPEGELHEGDAARVLIGVSEVVDVMVIGRGYGAPSSRAARWRVRQGHPVGGLPRDRLSERCPLGPRIGARCPCHCAGLSSKGRAPDAGRRHDAFLAAARSPVQTIAVISHRGRTGNPRAGRW